jgi:hypothetical protein
MASDASLEVVVLAVNVPMLARQSSVLASIVAAFRHSDSRRGTVPGRGIRSNNGTTTPLG